MLKWARICRQSRSLTWTTALLFACWTTPAAAQQPLQSYSIDPAKISISGISSGAFMANQVHLAHSELIMGAGLIAGGLYGCAVWRIDEAGQRLDATISRALDRCMAARGSLEPVDTYLRHAVTLAGAGWIDPLSGLAGDKVYLFTGRADRVVSPNTVARAAEVYRAVGIEDQDLLLQRFLDDPPSRAGAGHAWVTDDCCQPCEAEGSPFINDCGYDQSGALLRHIYGDLRPKAETLGGSLITYPQAEFAPAGEAAVHGLGDHGLAYVPAACAAGETCALHVVLHGCRQSVEFLGESFATRIGINEWADSNGIVVLYPQASRVERAVLDIAYPDRFFRNALAVNPRGCWNWWGYAYDDRFALKDGAQVSAVYRMIRRVMGQDAE